MIQPRNTLVVCKLIEKKDQQVGKITVPSHDDLYCEAEVIAVGPGTVAADGGRSETFDLKPNQRVWVKYKESHPQRGAFLAGIKYINNDTIYYVFEQSSIVGIIADAA